MSVTLKLRLWFSDRLGPLRPFRARHAPPSISSMNRHSLHGLTFDVSDVEPEGDCPSYSPAHPRIAPALGTVVLVVAVLDARTRSHTLRSCNHTITVTPRVPACRPNCLTTTTPFVQTLMHDALFTLRLGEMYDVSDAQLAFGRNLRPQASCS